MYQIQEIATIKDLSEVIIEGGYAQFVGWLDE